MPSRVRTAVPFEHHVSQTPLTTSEETTRSRFCDAINVGIDGNPVAPEQPETIPPQYGNFPRELARKVEGSIGLMVQHQPEFRSANNSAASVWGWLDRLPTALIQTLIQSYDGAQRLGIWPLIAQIRRVYAGSSWGIEWVGNSSALHGLVSQSNFCEDPDLIEAHFHPVPAHWWRHLGGGAGRRGMHVGVDAGVGFNNFHWDSNNPATERNNNPVLGALQDVTGRRSDQLNTESCRYSPTALVNHAGDVAGANSQDHDFPNPYIQFDRLTYGTHRVHGAVTRELGDARAPQRESLRTTHASLERMHTEIATMEPRVRAQSATPGVEHDPARRDTASITALRQEVDTKGHTLVQAMHGFARYLAEQAGTHHHDPALEQIRSLEWAQFTAAAADEIVQIHQEVAGGRG